MRILRDRRGMSLLEVVIAAAVLAFGFLGFFAAYGTISKSLRTSRGRTLATSLAQEKIETLKNKSYYLLLVTTATAVDTRFSPHLVYDAGAYAKETLEVGDVSFERATRVDLAQTVDNEISTVAYTSDDTGLKKMTVYVIWEEQGSLKKIEVTNLMENPDVNPLNTGFTGTVYTSTGGALAGATVKVISRPSWQDSSASGTGAYAFNVAAGTYTLRASKEGYYNETASDLTAPTTGFTTRDFTLVPIASGTASGNVWLNPTLLLSRVLGSSRTAASGADFVQEYVEVFNPTTFTWTVANAVGLYFQRGQDAARHKIAIDYFSTTIAAGGYYLFANTTPVRVADQTILADAVWSSANSAIDFPFFSASDPNIIPVQSEDGANEGSGALELYRTDTAAALDRFGWDRNNGGLSAPFSETEGLDENIGLQSEEQYLRMSSTAGFSATYGPAYDMGNNQVDWSVNNPVANAPRNSQSALSLVIAGVPGKGANASANDGLSTAQAAETVTHGSFESAKWTLTNIATGTWTITLSSSTFVEEIKPVTIAAGGHVSVPNAATTPPWRLAQRNDLFLTTETTNGYVFGTVTDVSGGPLEDVEVYASGVTTFTNSLGKYSMTLATGAVTVIANKGNANPLYAEASEDLAVVSGQVLTQDFTLPEGGTIKGYCTSGTTPLLNIIVNAKRDGDVAGTGFTDDSGHFYIRGLSTGTYTVEPVTDPDATASPLSVSSAVVVGAATHVGTFTISGAFGEVRGSVSENGALIDTGVLVIASTITIPASPPTLYGSSASLADVYYAATSLSDGTYRVKVRGSATDSYNLRAFYATVSGESASFTSKTQTGVTVSPGGTTTGVDFSWP